MQILPTYFRRESTAAETRLWPWLAGAGVGLLVVGGLVTYFLWARPKTTVPVEIIEGRGALTAEQRRLSDDIGESERNYRKLLSAGAPLAERSAALDRAITQQRQLLGVNVHAGIEQQVRLDRLLAARDTERAKEAGRRVVELQEAAEIEQKAGRAEVALEKLRVALQLQREADNSNADAHAKNFSREMALAQAIETGEAEPLAMEFEKAMEQARVAMKAERWSEALGAFSRARTVQTKINRDYPRTRFTNLPVLNELEAEIASLNAAGLAAEIDAREASADAAADRGRAEEAAGFYKAAQNLQGSLNAQFARSRFVSTARWEQLEIKRQTVLAAEMLTAAAALDQAAAAALLKRQVLVAGEKVRAAAKLLAVVEKDFPKTRNFDGALKIKLAFLELRLPELRALQDKIYDRLVPLPDVRDVLLLKSETPQELYAKIMSQNPSRNPGQALPVDSVSWVDAQEFCRRVSWVLGARVRLPREEEFRVALGDDENVAWSVETAGGHSHETAKQAANDVGFHDLAGNLAEWLQPAETTAAKVPLAGGSYLDAAKTLRTLTVASVDKTERARHIGFRFVVELALE